ncbi:MAG: hypothetical protein JWP31_1022 [Aeromicrobium sp.]|nr:hypothetical protein [Aeromicrobium sp.]
MNRWERRRAITRTHLHEAERRSTSQVGEALPRAARGRDITPADPTHGASAAIVAEQAADREPQA